MKKTNKKSIFKSIADVFDKYIITPITKFIMGFGNLFKSNKKGIERVLMNKQSLLIISLIAAFSTSTRYIQWRIICSRGST